MDIYTFSIITLFALLLSWKGGRVGAFLGLLLAFFISVYTYFDGNTITILNEVSGSTTTTFTISAFPLILLPVLLAVWCFYRLVTHSL